MKTKTIMMLVVWFERGVACGDWLEVWRSDPRRCVGREKKKRKRDESDVWVFVPGDAS